MHIFPMAELASFELLYGICVCSYADKVTIALCVRSDWRYIGYMNNN